MSEIGLETMWEVSLRKKSAIALTVAYAQLVGVVSMIIDVKNVVSLAMGCTSVAKEMGTIVRIVT